MKNSMPLCLSGKDFEAFARGPLNEKFAAEFRSQIASIKLELKL